MSRYRFNVRIEIAVFIFALWPATIFAQEWRGLANPMVEVSYAEPVTGKYRRTYEILKRRKVLEELSAFLSPIQLPRKLRIVTLECGSLASHGAAYVRFLETVGICYELVYSVSDIAETAKLRSNLKPDDVIAGTFVNVALHEVAHALFDILKIPLLGQEEHAADQLAAFVVLTFSPDLSRRMLNGYAELWRVLAIRNESNNFADTHGVPWQRFYNVICMAYGGQPKHFEDLVNAGTLPKTRAVRCHYEYNQVKFAFDKLFMPHLDRALLQKVMAINWAKWEAADRK